jgi:hypothetical protein
LIVSHDQQVLDGLLARCARLLTVRRVRLLLAALLVALAISASVPASSAAQYSTVEYFGYYAARLTLAGGDHLAEVADRSNLNWVQISDVDRYRPEVLDGCRPRGCLVYTGHEFFSGCDGTPSPSCDLYPNYRERWLRLAEAVRSRIDKVGAFYVLDEPQWHGASAAEVATAAQTIKETYPSIPVMMVEAGPAVTDTLQVPANVDWVGFDWYCRPFSDIQAKLAVLERRTAPHQRLFLLPEAAPLPECGGLPGHATDAEIASLQWDYFRLAQAHPRVIGLLAFGFWTSGHGSADLPLTVAAHRQIAARVIRPPTPPPGPPAGPPPPFNVRVAIINRRATVDPRGYVRIALRCPRAATARCAGALSLTTRPRRGKARRLARAQFALDPGRQLRSKLRIRRASRQRVLRRARRRGGFPARIEARTSGGTTKAALILRAARRR